MKYELTWSSLEAATGSKVCRVAWTQGTTAVDGQTAIIVPIFKKADRRKSSSYRPITLLSLPPKVYAKVLERNDTQCRFRPQQLINLFTLGQGLANRQDSHTLDHRLPRRASSQIMASLAAIRSFYNDCKSHDTRWSSAGMCILSTPLHYFYGEDLREKHRTRLYDDKSRVSALSTAQLQGALDRLCTSLQTKPNFCSSQDKTNSVLWMSMESKWRNWSSSGSNDGRLIDVLAQRVQFYDRFIDQWSLKTRLVGGGCWTSYSDLCSPTMGNDEYELIVEKSCNSDSSG